ncbi:MarR family transcriptional regulator [Caulobacter sp. Root655]|uniref:MarR family winged helix-turn-helix transcriptional regulator n=1 Tax=Caulobacter sp. Root655 TaxID=1736578 RepID=UPI0006F8B20E|nr:MarR family transcriptional regulator [Caulobacter sp. Root655]KRA62014.1 MarR family transcriptional regulator [Caulobacter sp. Root655]
MATDDPFSACLATYKSRMTGDPIGQRLKEISILTREIGKKIGGSLGVNVTDMAALEQLLTSGPLTPGELAARLEVTTAASTQIVDRLERAGHVRRERQAGDRRKVFVVPTYASVDRAFQQLAPMLDGLDGVIASLDQAERQVIERFLDQVIDVYRNVAGFPPSASEPL